MASGRTTEHFFLRPREAFVLGLRIIKESVMSSIRGRMVDLTFTDD